MTRRKKFTGRQLTIEKLEIQFHLPRPYPFRVATFHCHNLELVLEEQMLKSFDWFPCFQLSLSSSASLVCNTWQMGLVMSKLSEGDIYHPLSHISYHICLWYISEVKPDDISCFQVEAPVNDRNWDWRSQSWRCFWLWLRFRGANVQILILK